MENNNNKIGPIDMLMISEAVKKKSFSFIKKK
jgi:hypothetical protein